VTDVNSLEELKEIVMVLETADPCWNYSHVRVSPECESCKETLK
jgi:hypothetical protein